MGDIEISNSFREKLISDMENVQSIAEQVMSSFNNCTSLYRNTMTDSLRQVPAFFTQFDLMVIHQNAKTTAITEVLELYFINLSYFLSFLPDDIRCIRNSLN